MARFVAGTGGAGGNGGVLGSWPFSPDAERLSTRVRVIQRADPSPFRAYSPPPLWRDVALFVGTALAVGGLVWSGLRRLVKR